MDFISKVFAQASQSVGSAAGSATSGASSQQPGLVGMLTLFAPMFLIIYFLIIRPQQKKVKQHQATLEKLQHGDEVLTNSGMFGKVTGITDKVLTVEISDGVRVRMLKNQIASINPSKTANA